jgi:hypothetical protein
MLCLLISVSVTFTLSRIQTSQALKAVQQEIRTRKQGLFNARGHFFRRTKAAAGTREAAPQKKSFKHQRLAFRQSKQLPPRTIVPDFVLQPHRPQWVYLIGDSSLRLFNGALVERANGTLQDPHFGSYKKRMLEDAGERGDCEWKKPFFCLREYFRDDKRITYSFLTFANPREGSLADGPTNLISASQVPSVFVLGVGAWAIESGIPVDIAALFLARWVRRLYNSYPKSLLIVTTVVLCQHMYKEPRNKQVS